LLILDSHFHIDLRVKLPNGSQITGQEKALSNEYYSFKTFTMEFYQNRFTKEKGEFFNIASQIYLHGYSDITGFEFVEWRMYNIFSLLDWLKTYTPEQLEKRTRPSTSRASFLYINYDKIPVEFLIAKGGSSKRDYDKFIEPEQLELYFNK
jgi:hypothetical protein